MGVCAHVSIFEPCSWRSRHANLCSRARLFLLYQTDICTSHTDWVSSDITADVTPGAPLYFEKNVFHIEFQPTRSELSTSTWRPSIPTSCYVCLLLAKAVLSKSCHQSSSGSRDGGVSSVFYSYLGSPALYG